jgi:hypothetical protein
MPLKKHLRIDDLRVIQRPATPLPIEILRTCGGRECNAPLIAKLEVLLPLFVDARTLVMPPMSNTPFCGDASSGARKPTVANH